MGLREDIARRHARFRAYQGLGLLQAGEWRCAPRCTPMLRMACGVCEAVARGWLTSDLDLAQVEDGAIYRMGCDHLYPMLSAFRDAALGEAAETRIALELVAGEG